MIYQRNTKQLIDTHEYGEAKLKFLYGNFVGRVCLKIIVSRPFSRLIGSYNNSKYSVHKIDPTIRKYSINTNEFSNNDFNSFNEFFTRKLKPASRSFSQKPNAFIAVADAKLTYYKITKNLKIKVKNTYYTLNELVNEKYLANEYANGVCLAFRLTMDDCHRYIYPDKGKLLWSKIIPGALHTVQPIAHQKYKPYARNSRIASCLKTENFDDIIYIEVGALLVGAIRNNNKNIFTRGDEKGYFELGGSTIILLIKPDTVKIDDDIIQYSLDGVESSIKQGETIGSKYAK